MVIVKVKGEEIEVPVFVSSLDRQAVKIENRVMATLKRLGICRDDVESNMQRNVRLKVKARVEFWFEGRNLLCSYGKCSKYIENLFVVDFLLDKWVDDLVEERVTLTEFQSEFSHEEDLDKKLKEAREVLGVGEDCEDMVEIGRAYKKLAVKFHPDAGGTDEEFRRIGDAYQLIRRELE